MFLRELACVDVKLKPRTTGDCANFTPLPGDGWSHHPYSQNERPSRVSKPKTEAGDLRLVGLPVLAKTLDKLVRMGRLAPANGYVHLTEFGYETKGIPGRPRVDERQQARWLTWAAYSPTACRPSSRSRRPLRDQPPAPERVSPSAARPYGEYSTGLLNVDGSDKIAGKTFVAGLFAQLQRNGRCSSTIACGSAPGRRSSSCSARSRAARGGASSAPGSTGAQLPAHDRAQAGSAVPHRVPGSRERAIRPGAEARARPRVGATRWSTRLAGLELERSNA